MGCCAPGSWWWQNCRWGLSIADFEEINSWQKGVKLLLLCSELHAGSRRLSTDISVLLIAVIQRWAGKSVLQLTNELLCSHSVSRTGILGCFSLNVRIMWNPWNDHMNYVHYGEFHDSILPYCKRAHADLYPSFAWTKHGHAFYFYIWGKIWVLLWKKLINVIQ